MQLKNVLMMSVTLAMMFMILITPIAACQSTDSSEITATEIHEQAQCMSISTRNINETTIIKEATIPATEATVPEEIISTVAEVTEETQATTAETEPVQNEPVETEPSEPETIVLDPYQIEFGGIPYIVPHQFEYEGRPYTVPPLPMSTEPIITESGYVEKITEVPMHFQTFYPNTRYGNSTVRKSGCGIACVSMVLSYLLDEKIMPDTLAATYNRYKVEGGSSWSLFPDSAADYDIVIEAQAFNWKEVEEALKAGHVVIANTRNPSIFTQGGHFIVLCGITEDGKVIVRDPNLYNYGYWSSSTLKDGFEHGFDQKYLQYSCACYWIYQLKDVNVIASRYENHPQETDPAEIA